MNVFGENHGGGEKQGGRFCSGSLYLRGVPSVDDVKIEAIGEGTPRDR